jgi:hypothetical protein
MTGDKFLRPPYTYAAVIDFGGKEAINIPANVVVCEIRATANACDTRFALRIATDNNSEMILHSFGQDVWNIRVKTVYKFGTSAVVRDSIEVYGFTAQELREY